MLLFDAVKRHKPSSREQEADDNLKLVDRSIAFKHRQRDKVDDTDLIGEFSKRCCGTLKIVFSGPSVQFSVADEVLMFTNASKTRKTT